VTSGIKFTALEDPHFIASLDDEAVWDLFVQVIEREAPIAGLGTHLAPERQVFLECAATVRHEHGFMRARYYRTEDGRPLLNPFHIEHLTRLLIAFSFALYEKRKTANALLDCLFYILRGKCGINVFYRQPLTPFFLPRHALGTILGYGTWGACFYITQGCTVGQNHGAYPIIGKGLIMGPQSIILGDCSIGDNVTLAAGAAVIDTKIPDNKIVFGRPPNLVMRDNPSSNIDENYFSDKIMTYLA
jgi:serine O-acetyltransferase